MQLSKTRRYAIYISSPGELGWTLFAIHKLHEPAHKRMENLKRYCPTKHFKLVTSNP